MSRLLLATALACAALVALLAGSANAKLPPNRVITPGVGVGVVQLGDPMAEASAAWGVAQFCADRGGNGGETCVWDSIARGIAYGPFVAVDTGDSGSITLIAVAKPGWKTKQRIGVGSTRAETLAAYKGWTRVAPGLSTTSQLQLRHGTGPNGNPRAVTQFHFRNGRVTMISILAGEDR